MKQSVRNWIKNKFSLYDIQDLVIGGHCGCCGEWIDKVIVDEDWQWGICENCLKV